MPINIQKVASNTSTITITVGEDSAKITYSPALVTEETFSKLLALYSLQSLASEADESKVISRFSQTFVDLNETIIYLVRSWDIYATDDDQEKGITFPLETQALSKLPLMLRMAVIQGVMADIRPESFAAQAEPTRK